MFSSPVIRGYEKKKEYYLLMNIQPNMMAQAMREERRRRSGHVDLVGRELPGAEDAERQQALHGHPSGEELQVAEDDAGPDRRDALALHAEHQVVDGAGLGREPVLVQRQGARHVARIARPLGAGVEDDELPPC